MFMCWGRFLALCKKRTDWKIQEIRNRWTALLKDVTYPKVLEGTAGFREDLVYLEPDKYFP